MSKENIKVEGQEEDVMDASTKKIVKYIVIGLISISFLMIIITNTFFNINKNKVGITESFFSKEINTYTDSGIKMLNPLAFNKKTTYPTFIQSISFSSDYVAPKIIQKNNLKKIEPENIYNNKYKTFGLKVNTKDEINVNVSFSVSYRLKKNKESIEYVYNNTGDGNFIEKIVLPTITSSVSDIYSKYSLMDIVNKNKNSSKDNKISIGTLLKDKITIELDKKGFKLEAFTFSGMKTSDEIKKTIERLFNTQNELEIAKTKSNTIELQNKNRLKELELTTNINKKLKNENISIDDYQKIKMVQIFEEKWDGKLIPEGLNKLLK